MNEEKLAHMRHTLAHLLAAAVLEMYPDAKLTLGPPVDDGFYYDIDFGDKKISDKELPKIEKRMKKILPTWKEFSREEVSVEKARDIYKDNPYKLELVEEISDKGEAATFYTFGNFTDLCRGGHVENPKEDIPSDAFTLDRVAGAYWRGDENNTMLTRVYGLAFESKEKLDEYVELREEAKKRDHKKIGQELGLFAFSDRVGKGLPLFLPNGNTIREELEKFMIEEKKKLGYKFVWIPHIAKRDLYETSGHMGKYDAMMPVMKDQHDEELVMKAMNCPHHFELYNATQHSYRDLPLRYAENSTVYRNEKSGELSGLLRVKALTQDDTHHFVREDQIEGEIDMILSLMERVYNVFGFSDFKVEVSVRDPEKKENYFGDDVLWDKAENILITKVKDWGVEYSIEEGEAAFYGPKIDIRVKDAIGRDWQLTTVQLDFNQPENFNMVYTDQDGSEKKVVVLHVAILGSIERFMGVLIEHYAGNFPAWLSPAQVVVLPVSPEGHGAYTEKVFETLRDTGFRTLHDNSNESLGKRIRNAKTSKVPYLIVCGDKEVESNLITVEGRGEETYQNITVERFIEILEEKISSKS